MLTVIELPIASLLRGTHAGRIAMMFGRTSRERIVQSDDSGRVAVL
jgi:hypothetical protein